MDKVLQFLDGRKAIILAIAGLIIGYLSTTNVIDDQLAALILAILNILGGSAAYATEAKFGKAVRNK